MTISGVIDENCSWDKKCVFFLLFSFAVSAFTADLSLSEQEKYISQKLIAYLQINVITVNFSEQSSVQSLQWISNAIKAFPTPLLAVKAININGENLKTLLRLLSQTHSLDISNNALNTEDAQVIAESNYLRKLVRLDISHNKIGSQGAKAIASSKKFMLQRLNLSDNQILIDSIDTIVNSPRFRKLTFLDLSKNTLGNAGATAIANSVRLRRLRSLNLNETDMGDIGIMEILYKDNLNNLDEFFGHVQQDSKITPNAARMARIQFKDCHW